MKLCNQCGHSIDYHGSLCPVCSYQTKRIDGRWAFAPDLAEGNDGFEANYFERLAQLEAHNFWFRSRNKLVIWALLQYFPNANSFMEIGCGTGFVLSGIQRALPELSLCGSEIFSSGLSFAAQRLPGVPLFQMDARRIPFREEFDVIGAFDVLEHVEQDEEVLGQMYQATRQGGGILTTVPHHRFLWSSLDEFARHVRRYETDELIGKVRRAGFSIIRTTSFVSLLLPLLLVSRIRQRLSKKAVDPQAEYNMSRLLDKTFEKILVVERNVIRAGVSLPVGGSLLLVAKRN